MATLPVIRGDASEILVRHVNVSAINDAFTEMTVTLHILKKNALCDLELGGFGSVGVADLAAWLRRHCPDDPLAQAVAKSETPAATTGAGAQPSC